MPPPTERPKSTPTVGIMSMQRIFNYGSSLQAYCLRRLIENLTDDVQVEFLDFSPGEALVHQQPFPPAGGGGLARVFAKTLEYSRGSASVRDKARFLAHKRFYGRNYFPLMGIPRKPNHDLDVDVQVIGSDEVFNCVQANTNVGYARDLFGHGSPATRLISYAASFGNTTLDKIDAAGIRSELQADLERFSALSVRDLNSRRIIEALTGASPEVNVDPTIAYSLMSHESAIPAERLSSRPYVVVYGYSGRLDAEENASISRFARDRDAEILTFGGLQTCGDRFVDCTPFELLAYFRDAEAIVTDTFHGTIFSIINARPFATIVRPSIGSSYGNEEKLSFLLELFGLESRRVSVADGIEAVLEQPLDLDGLSTRLAEQRSHAERYLRDAVGVGVLS